LTPSIDGLVHLDSIDDWLEKLKARLADTVDDGVGWAYDAGHQRSQRLEHTVGEEPCLLDSEAAGADLTRLATVDRREALPFRDLQWWESIGWESHYRAGVRNFAEKNIDNNITLG
jgi:hypothetical protein